MFAGSVVMLLSLSLMRVIFCVNLFFTAQIKVRRRERLSSCGFDAFSTIASGNRNADSSQMIRFRGSDTKSPRGRGRGRVWHRADRNAQQDAEAVRGPRFLAFRHYAADLSFDCGTFG